MTAPDVDLFPERLGEEPVVFVHAGDDAGMRAAGYHAYCFTDISAGRVFGGDDLRLPREDRKIVQRESLENGTAGIGVILAEDNEVAVHDVIRSVGSGRPASAPLRCSAIQPVCVNRPGKRLCGCKAPLLADCVESVDVAQRLPP